VKFNTPGTHQPVGVVRPTDPALSDPVAPDLATILVLALLAAVVVSMVWKMLVRLAVIAGLTLVFAGVLVPVMMMAPPR
jgi:hypothetical protein